MPNTQPETWTTPGKEKIAEEIERIAKDIATKILNGDYVLDCGPALEAEMYETFPATGSRRFQPTGRIVFSVKVWKTPQTS